MGAAHNALWAFNARVSLTLPVCHRPQAATLALRSGAVRSPVTVVPSCGLETRSWRTGRMARHKQECIRLPYTAALASQRAFFVKVLPPATKARQEKVGNEVRQRASKNLENNLCLAVGLFITFSFIFLLLWLSKGRKARSYRLFPGNRPGNGIATGSATGCDFPGFFRREAPSARSLPQIRPAFFHARCQRPLPVLPVPSPFACRILQISGDWRNISIP